MDDTILGLIAVVIAAVFFGSFGLPIRSKKVQSLNLHPLVFQLYFSCAVFVTSWVALLIDDWSFTAWGVVGSSMFVPIMLLIFVAISNLGLALPVAIWAGITVNVSFIWGALAFDEHIESIPLTILALLLLVLGIIGLCICNATAKVELPSSLRILYKLPFFEEPGATPGTPLISDETELTKEDGKDTGPNELTRSNWMIGLTCAVVIGVLNGTLMVPARLAGEDSKSEMHYFLSFSIGMMMVTVAFAVCYLWYCIGTGKQFPELHWREATLPGLLSGTIWNVGNLASIFATSYLGLTIGFPLTQTSLLVSGMWGLLLFKELTDPIRIGAFFASAVTLLVGAFLLSFYG